MAFRTDIVERGSVYTDEDCRREEDSTRKRCRGKGLAFVHKPSSEALLKRKEPEPESASYSSEPKKKKQATLKFFL